MQPLSYCLSNQLKMTLQIILSSAIIVSSLFGVATPSTVFSSLPTQDQCAPGTAYDGQYCQTCPPNSYQPKAGQTECWPCPPGMVSAQRAEQCIICPPGQAPLFGNECGVCPPGEYYIPEQALCGPCTLNEFNAGHDLSTSCEPCVEGFSFSRAANCTICAPGEALITQFGPEIGVQSKCGICEGGHYYWPNTQACLPCQFNTFSTGGLPAKCEECPEGSFALPESPSCTYCPQGEVLLESGCGKCNAGEGVDRQWGTCRQCGPNHVSDGSSECRACAPGMFARRGSSSCFPCPDGTAFDVSIGECTTCKAGHYYEFSRAQCEQCIGIAPEPNIKTSTLCEVCPKGMVANEDSTECVPLSLGGIEDRRRAVLMDFLATGTIAPPSGQN